MCLDTLQCLHSVFVPLNEETRRGENFPSVLSGWLAVAWQQLILSLVLILHVILLVLILLLVLLLPLVFFSLSVRETQPSGLLPLAAAHQLPVELLVALGGFDGVEQLPGFNEVIVIVSLQVVRRRSIAGSCWAGLPVRTLLLLLLVGVS